MVSGPELMVMKYSAANALVSWPAETQKALKLKILTKYRWFYERLNRLERQIQTPQQNKLLIEQAREIKAVVQNNYPLANK